MLYPLVKNPAVCAFPSLYHLTSCWRCLLSAGVHKASSNGPSLHRPGSAVVQRATDLRRESLHGAVLSSQLLHDLSHPRTCQVLLRYLQALYKPATILDIFELMHPPGASKKTLASTQGGSCGLFLTDPPCRQLLLCPPMPPSSFPFSCVVEIQLHHRVALPSCLG